MQHRSFCLVLLCLWIAAPARAEEPKSAIELVDLSALQFVELREPAKVLSLLLDTPMRDRLTALPQYRAIARAPWYPRFREVVSFFELQSGTTWREALETITAGGLVGFTRIVGGEMILIGRSRDEAVLDSVMETVVGFLRAEQANRGDGEPLGQIEYRGFTLYKLGRISFGAFGEWFAVAKLPRTDTWTIDKYLDTFRTSMQQDVAFMRLRDRSLSRGDGWMVRNVAPFRVVGVFEGIYSTRHENIFAELAAGGALAAINAAPYNTFELGTRPDGFSLAAAAPFDTRRAPRARSFFFAPDRGGAPVPIEPPGTVLSLTVYRDLRAMFQAVHDLFVDEVAQPLTSIDSFLQGYLGGANVIGDFVAGLGPRLQLLVTQSSPDALPDVGFVASLREPKKMREQLPRAILGFASLAGQGDLSSGAITMRQTENERGLTLAFALAHAPMFTPTVVITDHEIVIATSKSLGDHIVEALSRPGGRSTTDANTRLLIRTGPIERLLRSNTQTVTEFVKSQSYLSSPRLRTIATLALQMFPAVDRAEFVLRSKNDTLRFEVDFTLKTEGDPDDR